MNPINRTHEWINKTDFRQWGKAGEYSRYPQKLQRSLPDPGVAQLLHPVYPVHSVPTILSFVFRRFILSKNRLVTLRRSIVDSRSFYLLVIAGSGGGGKTAFELRILFIRSKIDFKE